MFPMLRAFVQCDSNVFNAPCILHLSGIPVRATHLSRLRDVLIFTSAVSSLFSRVTCALCTCPSDNTFLMLSAFFLSPRQFHLWFTYYCLRDNFFRLNVLCSHIFSSMYLGWRKKFAHSPTLLFPSAVFLILSLRHFPLLFGIIWVMLMVLFHFVYFHSLIDWYIYLPA